MMITLTGFMGGGKTTVGRLLADSLGCPFMDLDDLIVKKAGKSIPDIFAQDGELAFRQLEAQLLRSTADLDNVVIATGAIRASTCGVSAICGTHLGLT